MGLGGPRSCVEAPEGPPWVCASKGTDCSISRGLVACLMPALENLGPRIRGPEPTDVILAPLRVPQVPGREEEGRGWEGWPDRMGDS